MPGKAIIAQVRQAECVTISGRMAYRARDTIIEATSAGYESGFTYFESLLSSICSKNAQSCYDIQFDDQGSFDRACLTSPFTDTNAVGRKSVGLTDRFGTRSLQKHNSYIGRTNRKC